MGEKVFTLRMDEELFERVKTLADKNKRSIAKEIEFQIEERLNTIDRIVPPAMRDYISECEFKFENLIDKIDDKIDDFMESIKK